MKAVGVVAAVLAGLYFAISLGAFPTYRHRLRLTIEVETPAGLKTSSSVVEVRTTDHKIGFPESRGLHSEVSGEAVFVDIGNGRHVIAALVVGPTASDRISRLAQTVFSPTHPTLTFDQVPEFSGSAPLTSENVPTLVTFGDLNDPKTARVVKPEEFEQTFGPGVRFKEAIIEMVPAGKWPFTLIGWPSALAGESVTRGIAKNLPWLPHPGYLSGRFGCAPIEPHCLHGGHFARKS